MTPQKAQMAQKYSLDRAIDQVAARLTRVDDDPALVSRIVATLPERVRWFGWLFHSWVPHLAAVAVVVTAGLLLWARRETSVTPPSAPIAAVLPAASVTAPPLVVENAAPNRTKPLEPVERLELLEPAQSRSDFERSLVAVAAPESLTVESLSPDALPAEASMQIAPLAIADLSMTEEFAKRE